jgi:hypothetical protein
VSAYVREVEMEGIRGRLVGGFNEDAADYPIRKFSLHFHRVRLTASNKIDLSLNGPRSCACTRM